MPSKESLSISTNPSELLPGPCPYCHRPFTGELVAKDKVDSSMVVPEPASRIQLGRDLSSPHSRGEDWVNYKLTYRCKHCGKEWTKLSETEVKLPRSYVKNEYEDGNHGASIE